MKLAPKSVQDEVGSVWRDMYTDIEDRYEVVPQLGAKEVVTAFEMWDKEIGAKK